MIDMMQRVFSTGVLKFINEKRNFFGGVGVLLRKK